MNPLREPSGPLPLVSVIIPFLDAERYLAEAIDSVLVQTCRSWELLLVDDGSTDASTSIARGYAARHASTVRYQEHPARANEGISASRNLGAARALGSYLAFLDGDDVFMPDKIERQVSFLEERPDVEAVFNHSRYWYSWADGGRSVLDDPVRQLGMPAFGTFPPGAILPRLLRRASRTPAICSVMIRRSAFDRVGGFENEFRGIYEDQAFFYKLFLHCRTHMIDGVFDWYRQHSDSCCAVAARSGDYCLDGGASPARRRLLDWFARYLRKHAPGERRLLRTVAVHQWLQLHPAIERRALRVATAVRLRAGS